MELDLAYVDYSVVGLTNHKTLKCLKSKDSKILKLAVGDQDGILQVLSARNDHIQLAFKTLPGEPITGLDIDEVQGDGGVDKIFVSSGTEIRGYTKKGKLFLGIETNLSEPIIAMRVIQADLLVTGLHCMTHYRDCKDIGSYICGDNIVDIAAIQIQNSNRVVAIVACRGGTIHAIERGRMLAIVKLNIGPCILFSPPAHSKPDHVFCGAVDGSLYNLSLDREHGSIDVHAYSDSKNNNSISAAGWWNGAAGFQSPLLILGYSNGSIQIYNLQHDGTHRSMQLIFNFNCDESITSVDGWDQGVAVATRSGRIFGLTTTEDAVSTVTKISKLRDEIQELESQVEKERSQYRINTQPLSQGLSAIPALQINDEWGMVEGDGARRLCISLAAPLDILLLQSSAPLQLFDTAPNAALLTRAYHEKGKNKLLATYRCQANTQQLAMRIGVRQERIDMSGELSIYVTPLLQPKCSQLLKYHIHPLYWHVSVEESNDISDIEYNTLTVIGPFSKAEIHAWLSQLLPDMAPRPSGLEVIITYQSAILGTILKCHYLKGKAEFNSDNISTISVIKDFLSGEATKKKVQLEITCTVNNNSLTKVLEKIHPKILILNQREKEIKIKNALSELQIDAGLENMLCKEYNDLLNQTKKDDKLKSLNLEQFYDIIINLFADSNKLKGINKKSKVPELLSILKDYDYETLIYFFENNVQ